MRNVTATAFCLVSCSLAVGCGGNVVFVEDGDGSGGAGGQGNVVTVSTNQSGTSTTTSTTTVGAGGGGPGLVEEVVGESVTDGPFPVDVTSTTLGLQAVARAKSDFADVTFSRLTAPSGAIVHDSILPNNGWEWTGFGTAAVLTPQVEHPETFPTLAPGTWTFDFHSASPTDVSVWRRSTADGAFHGGVLDVNIFIAGGVVDEDYASETAAKAYSGWGGIELGDIRFFTVPDQYVTVDDNNLFDLLKETGIAPTRPAINIIAVGEITGSLEGAAGFATGIPGAPLDHGSQMSAVVWMATYSDFFDPIILRHEGAHFGGLFHTSEFQAGLGDALGDTPLCTDANSMGELCPDYDYIMFPTGGSGASIFSAEQSRVLQASATYRGVYSQGEPPMTPYGPAIDSGSQGGSQIAGSRKASQAELTRAKIAASRASTRPTGTWSTHLGAAATETIEGIGCPVGPTAGYFADLEDAGALDADAMLAIAKDASAPPYVRRRAALQAVHLANEALASRDRVRDALDDLARDTGTPGVVRSGALRGLVNVDFARAKSVALALKNDPERMVKRAALAVGK